MNGYCADLDVMKMSIKINLVLAKAKRILVLKEHIHLPTSLVYKQTTLGSHKKQKNMIKRLI